MSSVSNNGAMGVKKGSESGRVLRNDQKGKVGQILIAAAESQKER